MGGGRGGLFDMKGGRCLLSADTTKGVVDQPMVFSSTLQPQQYYPYRASTRRSQGAWTVLPLADLDPLRGGGGGSFEPTEPPWLRACTHMYTHVHTCTHMYTHAHTCTHMHTHLHKCTHMHTIYTYIQHVHTRTHT